VKHAVRVKSLSKTFPSGKRALDDVSLKIEPGEMVALIGASGSGKSTLIRHIAGLITCDEGPGEVLVNGSLMQQGGKLAPDARNIRRQTGVIFQQFNLVGRLSVLTNVLTGRLGKLPWLQGTFGLFPHEDQLDAYRALIRVGIGDTTRQRASTLSGGQQQRAAIARALVQGASILLADEPIASLDPASARRVMETLSDVCRNDGLTVLVSLHQVEYARRFCARTVAMRDGRIVYDGSSRKLTNDKLKEIYGSASEELILPDAADLVDEGKRRKRSTQAA
jgi:phosphonate transport system ATP-binding protein